MQRFVKYLTTENSQTTDVNSEIIFSEWLEETKTVIGTLLVDLQFLAHKLEDLQEYSLKDSKSGRFNA